MSLLNLQTSLKSLKFGHDRAAGGNSNQPYETDPLPNIDKQFDNQNTDFILRGGLLAPIDSLIDVDRLTQYFGDLKSPSGLFFTLKQNLLSRTAVRTQASGKILNEGAYNPLSTILQAGVSAFGLHFNKQGLNPIPGSIGSLTTYSDVVKNNSTSTLSLIGSVLSGGNPLDALNVLKANRLVALHDVKITGEKPIYQANGIISTTLDPLHILSYPGGPGAILGIGVTNIKFADQRTGINNPSYGKNHNFLVGLSNSQTKRDIKDIKKPVGVSTIYNKLVFNHKGASIEDVALVSLQASLNSKSHNSHYAPNTPAGVYSLARDFGTIGFPTTNTQNELIDNLSYRIDTNKIVDFRAKIRARLKDDKMDQPNILSDSPDYNTFKIENRVNLGDPGNPFGKNLASYVNGAESGSASSNSFDKITVKPLYRSTSVDTTETNDLVKFRIAAIDNDDPSNMVFMHFRAFLDGMNDAYSADWEGHKYIGKGENLYTYSGWDRKFSLSFTVAAQSKRELIPIYKKLNYLASQLAPDYSKFGYMRGPMVQLTIGGYLYEQPGFITGLTYGLPEESPWEIGITDSGEDVKKFDDSVKELPHMIKVSTFNFTPIHNFVPKKAQWDNLGATPFIALTAGGKSNY